jgi:hypothetical protein
VEDVREILNLESKACILYATHNATYNIHYSLALDAARLGSLTWAGRSLGTATEGRSICPADHDTGPNSLLRKTPSNSALGAEGHTKNRSCEELLRIHCGCNLDMENE